MDKQELLSLSFASCCMLMMLSNMEQPKDKTSDLVVQIKRAKAHRSGVGEDAPR